MDFDDIYNVHCSLLLLSGRTITLEKIIQSRTYSGLLMGTPNRKSNDDSIQGALDRARQDPASLGKPLLIEPQRRDYFRQRGDMQSVLDRQQERPKELMHIPEWLPSIECIGVFHSLQPARDKTKDASTLCVVWYQHDFGFDEQAMKSLRLMDWDQYATDWAW